MVLLGIFTAQYRLNFNEERYLITLDCWWLPQQSSVIFFRL